MGRYLRCFVILCVVFCTASCGLLASKQSTTSVYIDFTERKNFSFSGKGAGAGMMMMSSMGPMGIAIGIAIDEGIAKDIQIAYAARGYDFKRQFAMSLGSLSIGSEGKGSGTYLSTCSSANIEISFMKHGFKIAPGSGDPVFPVLSLSVVDERRGQPQVYHYPEDFFTDLNKVPSIQLEVLKTDGRETARLLRGAFDLIAKRIKLDEGAT